MVLERTDGGIDAERSGAGEQPLDSYFRFDPGERRTYAKMDSPTETDVVTRVRSVEADFVRVVVCGLIAVRGRPHQDQVRPGWDVLTVEFDVLGRDPVVARNGGSKRHASSTNAGTNDGSARSRS